MDYQYKPATGFDTETELMAMGKVCPPLICLAMTALTVEHDLNSAMTDIQAVANGESLDNNILFIVDETTGQKVAQNCSFDLAVLGNHHPELLPAIFEGLEKGIFECTIVREKLLHLSSHGNLEFYQIAEGINAKIGYGLADMAKRYLGKDRTDDKKLSDSWRTNFSILKPYPVAEWPADARAYVAEDSEDCLRIREIQESERVKIWQKIGIDPFQTQAFQVACDFALTLMGAWGFAIDPVEKGKIEAMLREALKPENMKLLLSTGILRPGSDGRPHKKDPTKFTAPVKESIDKKKLTVYIQEFAARKGIELKRTEVTDKQKEKGQEEGTISTKIEFFEDHRHDDPLFEEYCSRQKLQKLVTTELPRMTWEGVTAAVVHPCYDVLKMTGRTSSFATDLYPSANIQNIDPRVRGCFVPRDGQLLFSIDYTGMELGTLAQKCYTLFGHSVLRDKINANIDCHAFLGAQLAYNLDDNFRNACDKAGASHPDQIFAAFSKCKKHESKEIVDFYNKYRKFAKPTGLGYPGGLGAETFIAYAKATYGVVVDSIASAKQLKNIWLETYPEMKQYFEWISKSCVDPFNVGHDGSTKYAYSTPMGMYRAGADYCAAANGASLQALSAEGAKLAVFNVIRACFDSSIGSILYGKVRPIAFVHDEILGEVPESSEAHDLVYEVANIMVYAMQVVTPDVVARAQPVLMRRWDKKAEPVFDKNNRLTVWLPKA